MVDFDCGFLNIHVEFGNWKHLNLEFDLFLEIRKETGVKFWETKRLKKSHCC